MPVLPTPFTASSGELPIFGGRRASGDDYSAGFGDAGAKIQGAAKSMLTDIEEGEARTALVTSSEIRAKYAKALDEVALSGGDTAALKQKMLDDLSKVGEQFQTKKGSSALQLYTANANLMFDQEANRIDVQKASDAAKVQASAFLNSESTLVIRNPLYLQQATQNAAALVATFEKIPPALRSTITKQIVQELNQAAAWQTIKTSNDPKEVKTRLEGGEWDLHPDVRRNLIENADREDRIRLQDKRVQEAELGKKEVMAVDAAATELTRDLATGKLRWADVRDNPAFRGQQTPEGVHAVRQALAHTEAVLHARRRELEGGPPANNKVLEKALWERVMAANDDPNKIRNLDPIREAFKQPNGIGIDQMLRLTAAVGNQTNENNQKLGPRINAVISRFDAAANSDPRMLKYDAQTRAAISLDYRARVEDAISEARNSGADINELFRPDNKNSVVNPAFIKQSVDNVEAAARANAPTVIDLRKTPSAVKELDVGAVFINPNGTTMRMTPALKAKLTEQAASAALPRDEFDGMIKRRPRSGFYVDAGVRSPAYALRDRSFATKEEAAAAIRELYK